MERNAIITVVVYGVIIIGMLALTRWISGRTKRLKGRPDRTRRLPLFVPILGGIFAVVGVLLGVVAFFGDLPDPLGIRITAVAIFVTGVAFVMFHRNFRIDAGPDEVRFRTVLGREKSIRYDDIAEYWTSFPSGQTMLNVRAGSGTTLTVNPGVYEVGPLLAHIEFHEEHGRWPLRGELRTGGSGLGG